MTSLSKYKYRTNDLLRVLVDVGFSKNLLSAKMKLYRLKNDGKFTPPQLPADERGDWVFTEEQLVSIARSLLPGGSGEWHFKADQHEL